MKITKTAPDSLKILWKEKVFLKPKDVKTIEAELEKRGYNFTNKNLMMALKDSKFLTRRRERKLPLRTKVPFHRGGREW